MSSEIILNLIFMAGILCGALPVLLISRRLNNRKDLEIGQMNAYLAKKNFEVEKLQKKLDELTGNERQARISRDALATRLKEAEKELAGIPGMLEENMRLRQENETRPKYPTGDPDPKTLAELALLREELHAARQQAAASQEELAVLWEKTRETTEEDSGEEAPQDPEWHLLTEENRQLREQLTALQAQHRPQQEHEKDLKAANQRLRELKDELKTLRTEAKARPHRRHESPLTRAQEAVDFFDTLAEDEPDATRLETDGQESQEIIEEDAPNREESVLADEVVALHDEDAEEEKKEEEDPETARMLVRPCSANDSPSPENTAFPPPAGTGSQILGDARLNPAQKETLLSMYCQFTRTTPASFSPTARGDARKAIKEDPQLTRAHKITIETVLDRYLAGKKAAVPH